MKPKILALALLAGCNGPIPPQSDTAASAVMPELVEMSVVIPDSLAINSPLLSLAVTELGTVTFRPGQRDDRLLVSIDSTGEGFAIWGEARRGTRRDGRR